MSRPGPRAGADQNAISHVVATAGWAELWADAGLPLAAGTSDGLISRRQRPVRADHVMRGIHVSRPPGPRRAVDEHVPERRVSPLVRSAPGDPGGDQPDGDGAE